MKTAALILVLLVLPSFAVAQEIPDTDMHRFFNDLGYNFTRGLFSRENVPIVAVGTIGASAIVAFDDEISDTLAGKSSGDIGQHLGGPEVILPLVGGCFIASGFTSSKKFRAFSYDLAQGMIMDEAVVFGLKYTVQRTRPNGEKYSFPSGHTSNSFVVATVFDHYYGHKIGIPLYGLASLIGASRIAKQKHYLSDVMTGAMIGYLTGRTAVRSHLRRGLPSKIAVMPYASENGTGLGLHIVF